MLQPAALMGSSIARPNKQLNPRQQLANTPPPQSTTPGLYPVSNHQMAPPERTSDCGSHKYIRRHHHHDDSHPAGWLLYRTSSTVDGIRISRQPAQLPTMSSFVAFTSSSGSLSLIIIIIIIIITAKTCFSRHCTDSTSTTVVQLPGRRWHAASRLYEGNLPCLQEPHYLLPVHFYCLLLPVAFQGSF